jgi:hypothetical protein
MNACDEGESQMMTVNVNLITAIGEENYPATFKIYPSPSSGEIQVFTQGIPDILEIDIYNALGQLIHHSDIPPGKLEFQIRNLPRGIHTVVLKSKAGNYAKMIIVQ